METTRNLSTIFAECIYVNLCQICGTSAVSLSLQGLGAGEQRTPFAAACCHGTKQDAPGKW